MRGTMAAVLWLCLVQATALAEDPCLACYQAAQEALKECLGNAISEEDKIECAEKQLKQSGECETGTCKRERERETTSSEDQRR